MGSASTFRRTAFAEGILRHAREDRARREGLATKVAAPMFELWTDGIFPSLAGHAERVARDDGVRIHSHAAAVNSPMVFGFNLFLPFRIQEPAPLAALLSRATNLDLRSSGSRSSMGRPRSSRRRGGPSCVTMIAARTSRAVASPTSERKRREVDWPPRG